MVSFKKGRLEVLSHAWDRDLGGRDFDEVLFEHFVKEFDAKFKLDVKSSPRSSFRLRLACEKVPPVPIHNLFWILTSARLNFNL